MASYIKRKFYKKTEPQKAETYECCLEDYDATYRIANTILSILCLKVTLQDAQKTSALGNAIFWFVMANVFLGASLESISMILTAYGGTLIELFTMMPCVGYVIVALSKAYKIKCFKPVFQNLVNELRSMWPVGHITEEEHNIIADSLIKLRYVVKAYFTLNMTLGFIFILPPYISLIKVLAGYEEQRLLPFFYWLPFDPLQDTIYEVALVVQSWHCFSAAGFMLSGDLLFCIFLSHITTQFALLAVRINKMIYVTIDNQLLESYPLGDYNKEQFLNGNQGVNNKQMEDNLEEELKKIIQRHRALIRLSGDIENMYTFSLLVNFINSSVIICFCLFCVTFVEKWNECLYKIFFMTAILQIWILCWYGQKLLDTSAGIGDALYNSGWYVSSNKIKKSILIMIHRSQKQVYITTFGFSIVSMASYATILKTSWSYFTLLFNMYKG